MNNTQKSQIIFVFVAMFYILYSIFQYWQADLNYSYGKKYNEANMPETAITYLKKSLEKSPNEPLFHIEIAKSYTLQNNEDEALSHFGDALSLSPANINLKKILYTVYIRLSNKNINYLLSAQKILEGMILQSPTDAKLYYNLGLTLWRMAKTTEAESTFQKTIELKPNYKEARFAHALVLIELKKDNEAKEQLEYILNFIDPNDELTKEELAKLK